MDRETATNIANGWYELVDGDERLRSAYHHVASLLQRSLPDDTEAAAGAPVDGQSSILALAGDGFFLTTFEDREGDESPRPVIERIALSPAPPTLRISDGWRNDPSGSMRRGLAMQMREWTLAWPNGRVVSFESIVRRSGGFHNGPDDAEGFGRALAVRLGWVAGVAGARPNPNVT